MATSPASTDNLATSVQLKLAVSFKTGPTGENALPLAMAVISTEQEALSGSTDKLKEKLTLKDATKMLVQLQCGVNVLATTMTLFATSMSEFNATNTTMMNAKNAM